MTKVDAVNICTIVVLIALAEEHEHFLEVFPYKGDLSENTQICLEHDQANPRVRLISILANQMGAQSASESAEFAISKLAPDMIVVVGIAGAVSGDVVVGDVCVSNEIIDVLQNNKVTDKGGKSDIAFAPDFYSIDADLVSCFTFLRAHPKLKALYEGWRNSAHMCSDGPLTDAEKQPRPKFEIGPIACGPVSASSTFNNKLKSLHRKVMAVETESGGIVRRAITAKIPVIALRGISDLANADKTSLELRTKGNARTVAMLNATELLKLQLANDMFTGIALRHSAIRKDQQPQLFAELPSQVNCIALLEEEIKSRLKELSPEYRSRPDGFYLPVPRAQRRSYTDDIASHTLEEPENIVDAVKREDRIVVRLPRSFPSQALGWALAYSLIRQQGDAGVLVPIVLSGSDIRPPANGLASLLPPSVSGREETLETSRIYIIEEPQFSSRTRLRFLEDEVSKSSGKFLILTKSLDNPAEIDQFVRDNAFIEYELAPISFSETAFFLERSFDMTASEAEVVAIKLDKTFRKFRLDAHPTYFAGLQEDTLAALIKANKRAELIQLAVDGLLSLMVAVDKSKPNLSRTTRERFLKKLVLTMATEDSGVDELTLADLAREFLQEYLFDINQTDFLSPFFQIGLLYYSGNKIYVTHPYLESYLLAQALRENPSMATEYFDPSAEVFNYYAFDLYCEMGPDPVVMQNVLRFSDDTAQKSSSYRPEEHVYLSSRRRLTVLSGPRQLAPLMKNLTEVSNRLEAVGVDDNIRSEKQRILDTERFVRSEVGNRRPDRHQLSTEVQLEFDILDSLSKALTLCAISVGSGAEALTGEQKHALARSVLVLGGRFSDIWTRNRLRVDFKKIRDELLSDAKVNEVLSDLGLEASKFSALKADLETFVYEAELNTILNPMVHVLGRIGSSAGVRVLAPVISQLACATDVEAVIRACWLMDTDPAAAREGMKSAMADYNGNPLMRFVVASYLLWQAYWLHAKTVRADYFIGSARKALAPIGLIPAVDRTAKIKRSGKRLKRARRKRA